MDFSNHGRAFNPLSYKKSNLLRLNDICQIQLALFVYDFRYNNLAPICNEYFIPKLRDGIRTRGNENNYYQKFFKTRFANLCIKTTAVKAWEKVPNKIKNAIQAII